MTKKKWRINCHKRVENDKDVYLAILKMFIDHVKRERNINEDVLHTSFNEEFGGWSRNDNRKLYAEIDKLWK